MKTFLIGLTKQDLCEFFHDGGDLEFKGNLSFYAPKKPDKTLPDCYAFTDSERAVFKIVDGAMVSIRNRNHPDHCIGLKFIIESSEVADYALRLSLVDLTSIRDAVGEGSNTWEDFTKTFDEEMEDSWTKVRSRSIINADGVRLPRIGYC